MTGSRLNTRGSTHLGGSGLVVLGLGSLVLLTGLTTPAATPQQIAPVVTVVVPPGRSMVPQWLGGASMMGVALLIMGARRRGRTLVMLTMGGV